MARPALTAAHGQLQPRVGRFEIGALSPGMDLEAARVALTGISVGDAFGTTPDGYGAELARRAAKRLISMKRPWRWTDDTAMSLSIVEAPQHTRRFRSTRSRPRSPAGSREIPYRGYGAGAHGLLARVNNGASRALTKRRGCSAARDRPATAPRCVPHRSARHSRPTSSACATRRCAPSAEPTHAHPDGAAGAVAVAIAAALARAGVAGNALVGEVARWTPEGPTRDGVFRARELGVGFDVRAAGEELGTG